MLNFTVGPVQSSEEVLAIGAESAPYFRTAEFSEIMLENETFMKKFAGASVDSRTVFLTGSGTAAMEAAIVNTLSQEDRVLIVSGGSFGERFVEICNLHKIPNTPIQLEYGHALLPSDLEPYDYKGYTAFVVNLGETSTGVLYDAQLIHSFCERNQLFLIVDAVSSFITDPFYFDDYGVDVMLTGSQKALAVPPGISIVVLSEKAIDRINEIDAPCYYLNLKSALINGERGQTPFTPAVTTLLQINKRFHLIEENGGIEQETSRIANLAMDFRTKIQAFPFTLFANTPSNAVTSLQTPNHSAKQIFTKLKDEFGIWICPNGGSLANDVFRVGHLGNLTVKDNDILIQALKELQKRDVF